MNLSLLKNGRYCNARPITLKGKQATEFHVGFVNYLNSANEWAEIDCIIKESGAVFEVTKAPFECTFPLYADGEAFFNNTNRFDVFNKSLIDCSPLEMIMVALDASHVQGQLFDINGDGRLDAVLYPQAFPQWDADLIYYVQHGRAPRLQKLIRFNSVLGSNIQAEFYLEYTDGISNDIEISSRIIPNGKTRRQWRDDCRQTLNTPASVSQDKGFYIRAKDEAQKRGIGIKEIKIWDSAEERKEEAIIANIRKSGTGYKLTKHVDKSFFTGATFPCYTDATSTFYPDPHPETNTIDGWVRNFNENWATCHNAAIGWDINADAITINTRIGQGGGGSYEIRRSFVLFDISAIGTDEVSSATLGTYLVSTSNGDNDGDDYMTVVQSSPASDTNLIIADYDQCGAIHLPTEGIATGDRLDLTGLAIDQYYDFSLDSTGLGWVTTARDGDGIIRLGMREGHDTQDHIYADGLGTYNSYACSSADEAGTMQDPKLVIEHSSIRLFNRKLGKGLARGLGGGL